MIGAIGEGTILGGGRYSLQARVGSGGAATVWLADDDVLDRPVAVKVLSEALASDDSWLARFRREARLVASLTHPNLVSVYDFDASDERPYIVMAYMPGGSLWDRLQLGEPSDPERLARDLLTALEAIHAAGIVHRDIKPGNVLFDAAGTACLTDFGVARPEDATALTQTGQIPGTARFMAPELWAGEPADERTDLYSAGVVLREAIGNDGAPQTRALVDRLCAEDVSDRPESATAALGELDRRALGTCADLPAGEPTPRTIVIQSEKRSGAPRRDCGTRAAGCGCDRRHRSGDRQEATKAVTAARTRHRAECLERRHRQRGGLWRQQRLRLGRQGLGRLGNGGRNGCRPRRARPAGQAR